MAHHSFITGSLLVAAVVLSFLCALGVLVMRSAYQRMQFSTPVVSIAALCVTVAIWIEDPSWQARIKSVLIALILFLMNAILSHATARAIRIRDADRWPLSGDDQIPIVNTKGKKIADAADISK